MAKPGSFPYTLLHSDKCIVSRKGRKRFPQLDIALWWVSKGLILQSQMTLSLAEARFQELGGGGSRSKMFQ